MAYKLKDFLKDWYKAYHFHMMPEPIRSQWIALQSEDDFDIVTAETQELYHEFIKNNAEIGKEYSVTVQSVNLEELRKISGNEKLNVGDKYNFSITDDNTKEQYLKVASPKLGDKLYYSDLRSGGQKGWGNKKTGGLAEKPLPDINSLSDAEQEHFYRIIRTTLRNINDDPLEFPDPDNPPKVANFLGTGKAFENFKIQDVPGLKASEADAKLKKFAELISSNDIMRNKLNDALSGRFGDNYSVGDFITDLKETTIRPRALNKVINVLSVVDNWQTDLSINPAIKNSLSIIFGGTGELEKLIAAVNQENEKIDPVKMAQFKDSRVYAEILKSMYDSSRDGKISAFNDQFAKYGGNEITSPMGLVVKTFNYDGLAGKYKDKPTWWQKKKDDWGDWKDEHITKLYKRNLRHNYIEPNAKGVVDAICKLEISPTDGLKKILEKKSEIKKIISQKSPASEKGFDFLVSSLEKINNSGGMKNAFAGALKNGNQAEAIAKEIIKDALAYQPSKIAEAKIALETLSVMRYDMFSSGKGKEISKSITGMNLLEGTSIMNNKAISFVITGAQKTINFGLNSIFWMGIMTRNLVQHSRGKIPTEDIKKLTESMDKIRENAAGFNNYESAEKELAEAQKRLDEFNAQNMQRKLEVDNLKTQTIEYESKKDVLEEELISDSVIYKYESILKEIELYFKGELSEVSDDFGSIYQRYQASLGAMAIGADQREIILKFKKYCENESKRKLSSEQKAYKNGEIENIKKSLKIDNEKINNFESEKNKLEAELNIAKDIFTFQKKKKVERAETKTEHNPGEDPLNELENAQILGYFWNACNGYDFGLNINDYNMLKKYDHQPQKLQFNMAVKSMINNSMAA